MRGRRAERERERATKCQEKEEEMNEGREEETKKKEVFPLSILKGRHNMLYKCFKFVTRKY